ncbi:FAR1 DNA binding domain-containing protein [Tanacetum coccineum]
MEFTHEHQDPDMGESSMVRDHNMGESSMVRDHNMVDSSMVRHDQVDNQIVVLPKDLQHHDDSHEFQPTPNGTPYWVPDVPEDEKPKEGGFKRKNGYKTHAYFQCNRASKPRRSKEVNTLNEVDEEDGENSASKKRKRHSPTRAHRLKAALVGGYDKVRGTLTNYCNFKCCVNSFIGDRDAQMLVDKMCKRKLHIPEFCFEYYTLPLKELVRLFWADETMKCNYVAFGDVVSFDATSHTNKYGYKFVPFTGIDHNHRFTPSLMYVAYHRETTREGDLAADNNFRKDFHKLVWNVYIGPDIRSDSQGSVETCIIQQMDKRSNPVIRTTTKNVLPAHLLDKRHRYGPCNEETNTLASRVHQTIEECIGLFRNDTDKLSELLSTVQDLKKRLENEMQTPHVELNKDALYSDLLDVTVPDKVVIKTPKSIFRSKGTRRIKSAAEKSKAKTIARNNRKVPFKRRTCSVCGGKGHNKATCKGCSICGQPGHHKGICKKFPNQDKGGGREKNIVVDDEDEGDTDDQFDDEALGATEDEFDEDDEIDDEYKSDEE